jgi:hypothetical protein
MRYDAIGAVSRSAASRYGVFTRTQATSLGLDRRTIVRLLDAGTIRVGAPGVYVWTAVAPSWEQRLAVAQASGGGHGVVSHRSSSRLHVVDGLDDCELLELSSTRRLKVSDAVVHQVAWLSPQDIVTIKGFRTTNLARTLCDLGCVVDASALERALDSARRAGVSLRWVRETALRLHRPGQTGTSAILEQLDAAEHGGRVRGSWFERTIELMLDDPRIPRVVRQFEVRGADGSVVARPDLAIPELKFAIEGHSRAFHFGELPEGADEDRDHCLVRVGWDAMYLGRHSTRRPVETVELVADAVAARAELLGIPLETLLCPREVRP